MNVGLPGTGIGGLFYLLTSFIILVYELFMTARGRSNSTRWKLVGEQVGITVAMIAAAVVTNTIISMYMKRPPVVQSSGSVPSALFAIYANHPILFPVTLLFVVLGGTQIARVFLMRSASHQSSP